MNNNNNNKEIVPAPLINEFTPLTCDEVCPRCNSNVCVITTILFSVDIISVERARSDDADGTTIPNMLCIRTTKGIHTINFPCVVSNGGMEYFFMIITEHRVDQTQYYLTIVQQCSEDGRTLTRHSKIRISCYEGTEGEEEEDEQPGMMADGV